RQQHTTGGLYPTGVCEISARVVKRCTGLPLRYGHDPQLTRRASRSDAPTVPLPSKSAGRAHVHDWWIAEAGVLGIGISGNARVPVEVSSAAVVAVAWG
ncbi:MAG: hypothetical protein O7C01_07065, partial [Actinobacteria bacterium]|nr:hypothetical protein [Actinomycetota bacterium]